MPTYSRVYTLCWCVFLQVEVFSPVTQRTYYFPCNAWLEEGKDGIAGCSKALVAGGWR